MAEITVVGGGIAGLTAAITAADAGGRVRLLEARAELGGRARTSPPPHRANLGPHALYTDGAFWQWLETERLLPHTVTRGDEPLLYRHQGELAARPPALGDAVAKILAHPAPPEAPFRDWTTSLAGPEASELLVGLAFVFTFDYDPGRLSAAFVAERLSRVVKLDAVRYVVGGWQALVEQLTARAAQAGVNIEMRSRARELPPLPVVVATPPAAARRLLGEHVHAIGTRVGLTDVALATEAPLPSGVLDLDEGQYLARYTAFDRTLAPPGEELIQIVAACQPHERTEHIQARIDRLLDQVAPGWRSQLRWSRRSLLANATGALDLPYCDRNARPTISQGSGLFIAGDYVAAPGLLSEASFASGREAGLAAAAFAQRRSPRNHNSARSHATHRSEIDPHVREKHYMPEIRDNPPRYDRIGHGYARTRREDPRLARRIHRALGSAQTVVNVGAGAGSYEPLDRYVIAIEPSDVMAGQRPAHLTPAIRASAGALPLRDHNVDAAMAILSIHHWDTEQERGVREMRRVARGPVVILTCDPAVSGQMWLMAEYLPEVAQLDHEIFPTVEQLANWLGGKTLVEPVKIPRDTPDWTLVSFWAHPERVLDPQARNATSGFARMNTTTIQRVEQALARDLQSGAWDRRHGHLRQLKTFDAGLRLITNTPR